MNRELHFPACAVPAIALASLAATGRAATRAETVEQGSHGIGAGEVAKAEIAVNGRPVTKWTPCDRGAVDADRPNGYWRQMAPKNSVLLRAELENDGEPVQLVEVRSGGACKVAYLEIETY